MATVEAPRRSGPSLPPVKRSWVSSVSADVRQRPSAMIIYGVPGIGKTSIAAEIPGVVFLIDSNEDGINRLKEASLAKPNVAVGDAVRSWEETMEALEDLRVGEHKFKCLAVDAIGGFERLCHEYVCRTEFRGKWGEDGFMAFAKGPDFSVKEWMRFTYALDRLRDEKGMSILLLGHAKISPFKNPEGPDYDRYNVDVHHKTWSFTHKWADMVLFANYDVAFPDQSKQKAKAKGGKLRTLHCEHSAAFDAKNRHGLPESIDMGTTGAEAWVNLSAAIKAGKQREQVQ
jgi:hypothetical protein